ncbi:MAG: von Willebrand factor type A domain-containing protein [Chitinophagaceae bacterium]|nr:von Willebrand factor type A domain-containing protein [Chitinophagaceae bacterium]
MKYIIACSTVLLITAMAFLPKAPLTVKGNVKDNNGNVLQYASVAEKGTGNMVQSDVNGNFTITVKKADAVLFVSCIGYETKEIRLTGKSFVQVELAPIEKKLDEAVVAAPVESKKMNRTNPAAVADRELFVTSAVQARRQAFAIARDMKPAPDPAYNGYVNTNDSAFNTEDYDGIVENRFLAVKDNPLSTFSIDVDAASYSNIRRYLNQGQLPPAGAVRIEEMINYFQYKFPQPTQQHPFAVHTETAAAPWNEQHRLVLVNLQGKKIPTENLPSSNLVFLIDVSGSMEDDNKLPLVKQSMKLLTDQLRENDRVAIVVYAGNAGLVLPATSGAGKQTIKDAIDRLEAGGSTAGGAGIQLAYKVARENFRQGGNNRVILCTDGDFNVGASSDAEMERLIEQERKSGVFLTVLGYGMGNYKDNKMQKLADKGNGNHAYIDDMREAKKVLVHEFGGTLFTIAKDVKLQVEFNPAKVQAYRLIGYENRMLHKEDFNNDQKDAGELGSGHSVTALYEIIPAGVKSDFIEKVDPLKYQSMPHQNTTVSDELMTIKFRYKKPDADISELIEYTVKDSNTAVRNTSDNFRFAAAVAQFGMLLRNSGFRQNSSFNSVLALAGSATAGDTEGYRKEFISLVQKAGSLVKVKIEDTDISMSSR